MRVGVLAHQGAFAEHISILADLGAEGVPIRLPEHLERVEGLIIPGGESTTISKLNNEYRLARVILEMAGKGMPVFGTCAGMILMASVIGDDRLEPLKLIDITIRRNAFGRQRESFEADLRIPALGEPAFHGVFIRAPQVEAVGPGVEVLSRLDDGAIVAVRQGVHLALAFHPELGSDMRCHRYFLDIINGVK
ncbi:pyridoxal 5'-phosphate synthase glutaminase subunit PdxT [Chloroflexota bacterium]